MTHFLDRHLPVFQMPDAPTSSTPPSDTGSSASSAPSSDAGTPSSTPSDASAHSDTPTPVDGDGAFEFMFSSSGGEPESPLDGGVEPPPSSTSQVTPQATQPAPATAPTQPAVPPDVAQATPGSAAPASTESTSPQPAEAGANLDPFDPGHLAQALQDNFEQVVQQVADAAFKLSDKDVEDLETNVTDAIPRLLARGFVTAQRNFLMQMQRIVPAMIERHSVVTTKGREAEDQFYGAWPDLAKAKTQQVEVGGEKMSVAELVRKYAIVYGQMHPGSTREQRIAAVGPMAMMAARIVPGAPPPAGQRSPMTAVSGRPPQPAPFVPAGAVSGGASQQTAPQLTPVEAMFAEHEQ